jgi:hypothetical protein
VRAPGLPITGRPMLHVDRRPVHTRVSLEQRSPSVTVRSPGASDHFGSWSAPMQHVKTVVAGRHVSIRLVRRQLADGNRPSCSRSPAKAWSSRRRYWAWSRGAGPEFVGTARRDRGRQDRGLPRVA